MYSLPYHHRCAVSRDTHGWQSLLTSVQGLRRADREARGHRPRPRAKRLRAGLVHHNRLVLPVQLSAVFSAPARDDGSRRQQKQSVFACISRLVLLPSRIGKEEGCTKNKSGVLYNFLPCSAHRPGMTGAEDNKSPSSPAFPGWFCCRHESERRKVAPKTKVVLDWMFLTVVRVNWGPASTTYLPHCFTTQPRHRPNTATLIVNLDFCDKKQLFAELVPLERNEGV